MTVEDMTPHVLRQIQSDIAAIRRENETTSRRFGAIERDRQSYDGQIANLYESLTGALNIMHANHSDQMSEFEALNKRLDRIETRLILIG